VADDIERVSTRVRKTRGVNRHGARTTGPRFRLRGSTQRARMASGRPPPVVLETIGPWLGTDCHIIAKHAWRQAAVADETNGGRFWAIEK